MRWIQTTEEGEANYKDTKEKKDNTILCKVP